MRFLIFSMAVFCGVSYLAVTASYADEKAHEHGVGVLNLAVEGNAVEIELMVPGADAVGFEHAPSSAEDRHAIEEATRKLKAADQLFRFPAAAQCRIEDSEVHAAQLEGDHEDDDHGRKEKHDDDHDHAKKDEDGEAHAEFRAHYHFHCENPDALSHIDVTFFKVFPSARELDARTITTRGQGAVELTPSASRLKL